MTAITAKAMLDSHPLDKALQFFGIAEEFITFFLDKYQDNLDERDLEKLEKIARYHSARCDEVVRIHHIHKASLREG